MGHTVGIVLQTTPLPLGIWRKREEEEEEEEGGGDKCLLVVVAQDHQESLREKMKV